MSRCCPDDFDCDLQLSAWRQAGGKGVTGRFHGVRSSDEDGEHGYHGRKVVEEVRCIIVMFFYWNCSHAATHSSDCPVS